MLLLGITLAQAGNTGDGALTVNGNDITVTTGGQFTANKADATTLAIAINDVFIRNAGDNMDGALPTPLQYSE